VNIAKIRDAFNDRHRFLKDWERKDYSERSAGRLLDFQQVSKEFNDPACVVDSGMLHCHNPL